MYWFGRDLQWVLYGELYLNVSGWELSHFPCEFDILDFMFSVQKNDVKHGFIYGWKVLNHIYFFAKHDSYQAHWTDCFDRGLKFPISNNRYFDLIRKDVLRIVFRNCYIIVRRRLVWVDIKYVILVNLVLSSIFCHPVTNSPTCIVPWLSSFWSFCLYYLIFLIVLRYILQVWIRVFQSVIIVGFISYSNRHYKSFGISNQNLKL